MTTTVDAVREIQDVVVAKRKPGGQPGNRNALKAGYWSTRNRATRSKVGRLKRSVRDVLRLANAAINAREVELSSPVYGVGGSPHSGETVGAQRGPPSASHANCVLGTSPASGGG
ncbi:MAG: hypothetical protein JO056_01440 [Alphaproteobacteria bacterium]|nr:hypothetical protein [Alphaproteobacteria bacterium]